MPVIRDDFRITDEWLRSRMRYDAASGKLIWFKCSHPARNGKEVGSINPHGYRVVNFGTRPIAVHRLIWLYVHGAWPKEEIDHINGRRDDNRLCNLREATRSQNSRNRPALGGRPIKGITRTKRGRYQAQIRDGGRNIYVGLFDTAEEAGAAYAAKAAELHGEFVRVA